MDEKRYESLTDAELSALAANDEAACAEIVKRHLGTVRRLAGAYSEKGCDFDDLFSEGLVGLLSAVRTFDRDKGAAFGTYAYTCVCNRMINAVKKANRIRVREEPIGEQSEILDAIPERTVFSEEETRERYSELERHLSDLERDVLTLRFAGLSREETSEKLGITPKSVDNALSRIRRKVLAEKL